MGMPSKEVLIAHLYTQVHSNFRQAFEGVISGPEHLHQMTEDALNPNRAFEQLTALECGIGQRITNKRILEVGCGHGLTIALARANFGADAYGIEPGKDDFSGALAISRKVLVLAGLPTSIVLPALGEALPFRDNWFDVVFSSNVLEHVRDPQTVIDESLRVLKPGGFLKFVVPNYGSWWEGHYGLLWFPNMPVSFAKLYVRSLGRDPSFIDTLKFINYSWLKRIVSKHRDRIEILGWGTDIWKERIETLAFSEWAALRRLKRMVRWIHMLGLVKLVVRTGKALHWETPLILTLKKTK